MISDDERRKVAARLRSAAGEGDVFDGELLCILGVGPGESDDFSDSGDVLRLADLIDRLTCRDVNAKADAPINDMFECSECGFEIDTWDNAGGWKIIRYCPNCGAEVVRHG